MSNSTKSEEIYNLSTSIIQSKGTIKQIEETQNNVQEFTAQIKEINESAYYTSTIFANIVGFLNMPGILIPIYKDKIVYIPDFLEVPLNGVNSGSNSGEYVHSTAVYKGTVFLIPGVYLNIVIKDTPINYNFKIDTTTQTGYSTWELQIGTYYRLFDGPITITPTYMGTEATDTIVYNSDVLIKIT